MGSADNRGSLETVPLHTASVELVAHPQQCHVLVIENGRLTCRPVLERKSGFLRQETVDGLSVISGGDQSRSSGLVIELRGTPQLNNFPQAREAFLRAAARWESKISTPVKVVMNVDFGATRFGQPFPSNVLGSTTTQDLAARTGYPTVREALIQQAGSEEKKLAAQLPASSVPTDLGLASGVVAPISVFRALGLLSRTADPDQESNFGSPPSIGFNSNFEYDFNSADGISANLIDFEAVVTHEIGHVLGFTSNVGYNELVPQSAVLPTVWDLFRFRVSSPASFAADLRAQQSGGSQFYFDGRSFPLSTGRPDGTGGDRQQASHWKDDAELGFTVGLMDPSLAPSRVQGIEEADLRVIDHIGWTLTGSSPGDGTSDSELKTDDGIPETGFQSPGLCVVNRLTPTRYPCRLESFKFYFPRFSNQPSPVSRQVRLIAFYGNQAGSIPPASPELVVDQMYTISEVNTFVEIPVETPPLPLLQGDLYVGYQVVGSTSGLGFAADTTKVEEERVFFSIDNARTFTGPLRLNSIGPVNALLRARVAQPGGEIETDLRLISPNGGEMFSPGQQTEIQWTVESASQVEEFEVTLIAADDSEFTQTLATGLDASTRAYEWSVPDLMSDEYLVEITAFFNDGTVVSDISDDQFEISSSSPALSEELTYDSGVPDRIFLGTNLMMVNRFTPSQYPARFTRLRVYFSAAQGYPSPVGRSVTLVGFAVGSGAANLPRQAPLLLRKTVVISELNTFVEFSFDPIIVETGNLCLGYRTDSAPGVGFACNTAQTSRSYLSRNNGKNYRPVKFSDGSPGQALIRAVCEYSSSDGETDSINPVVQVLKPASSESVAARTVYRIEWTASDNIGVETQNIEFEAATTMPIATGLSGTTLFFDWSVPETLVSVSGRIRWSVFDRQGNEGTALSPTIRVIPPSGGGNEDQVESLAVDDGTAEVGAFSDGLLLLNRLTPTRFPARLSSIQIYFAKLSNQPDPVGQTIQLRIYEGAGTSPVGLKLVASRSVTVPATGRFATFSIDSQPLIASGNFWVGYQVSTPAQGVGFATDTNGVQSERTFYSTNGGQTYSLLRFADGKLGTALIRAEVRIPK